MAEKHTGIEQSGICWLEWHFPKDMEFETFYVIDSFYNMSKKKGETRIVKFTNTFYDLGEYETLETYETAGETEKGHKKYNEKFKGGKLKCTLLS